MKLSKRIFDILGKISEWSAKTVMWLVVVLIVIVSYDVLMRYIFNAPTNWQFVLSYMLFATSVALGWAYVHYLGGNVRVDILYAKFPIRTRLIIDTLFTLIFFFPSFSLLSFVFIRDAWYAYSIAEKVTFHGTWYPITWPYKTAIALGFCLLFLQGIANFLKDVISLAKGGEKPW